jgi:hypothetical protein
VAFGHEQHDVKFIERDLRHDRGDLARDKADLRRDIWRYLRKAPTLRV